MTVIVCIDDRGGMLFNNRRQSRDRVLTADALSLAEREGKKLYICGFSQRLFEGNEGSVVIDEDFLNGGDERICFVENRALAPYIHDIDRVVVYRWNRTYPFDKAIDIDLATGPWRLGSTEEFAGYSHEKITKEIYVK